jgi:hypothetical protein
MMGTWEPGVPYTDPTPDQITTEVSTDRDEDPADPANIPLGGDLSGTTSAAVINIEGLSALADSPPGTIPIPGDAHMLGIEAGGVATWEFDVAVQTNRIDQMAAPTAALTWTAAALTAASVNAASGTASDGSVSAAASAAFFGGGILGVKSSTAQAGFRSNLNVNGLGMGNGTTTDITFERTGTNTATITATSGLTIAGNVTLSARNIITDTTTGMKIGTAVTQKLGFYNATPVVQPSGASQAAVTTTAATQTTPWGFSTQAQADAIVTLVNALRTAMVNTGLIKGSA